VDARVGEVNPSPEDPGGLWNAGSANEAPPAEVLAAFGLTGEPRRLAGGKNGTWRCGDAVLKPAEGETETLWRCEVLQALPEPDGFRVARPLRTEDGGWLAAGWEAAAFVAGTAAPRRVDEVIIAGQAFHQAIAALPRPSFLDLRLDPWAYGDRLAWEREGTDVRDPAGLLAALLAARRPVSPAAQVVHGDLLGNVLFADGLPPAIIDWPAYWRAPAWASAVAVVDALCWHGVQAGVLDRWAHLAHWRQMLIRALIYRIATTAVAGWRAEPVQVYKPIVDLVLDYRDEDGSP
jgi:uncharacterized protein (TIGR02569 family)